MPGAKIGKTGNAPILRQGQTEDGMYGSNPSAKQKGDKPARDLTK